MSSTFPECEKGSAGTRAMWLLSQMMRDSETERRRSLWAPVKTPSSSHQNLQETESESRFSSGTVKLPMALRIHLSPSLRALNCLDSRQARSAPTRPPGRAGSAMAPTHTSML